MTITVIGVRFKEAGKIYYFDPDQMEINAGDHVIVETARGIEYGSVVVGLKQVSEEEIVPPLKKVIRVSTPEDDAHVAANAEYEKEAFQVCEYERDGSPSQQQMGKEICQLYADQQRRELLQICMCICCFGISDWI
jgi:hypothetical protein